MLYRFKKLLPHLRTRIRLLRPLIPIAYLATLASTASCQTALPEFFGFYAVGGGRTVALVDGKDSDATRPTREIYSIPQNRTQGQSVPEVTLPARFLLFYANAGEMVKSMALHRLPFVRNVLEVPDNNQVSMGLLSGKPVTPRITASPNKPLLARLPELEARILSKPVPNQAQMIELVPNSSLAPGLYVFDYRPSPTEGWYIVISIHGASGEDKPMCLDLKLPGGPGGQFFRANSNLNDAVPALQAYDYQGCGSNESSVPGVVGAHGSDGSVGGGSGADLTSAWDKELSLGHSAAIRLCRDRGGVVVRSCQMGTLLVGSQEVAFALEDGQRIFAAAPSQVRIKRDPMLPGVFVLEVGGKSSRFQYPPQGIACEARMQAFAARPAEGVAQQNAVMNYLGRILQKLAAGEGQ